MSGSRNQPKKKAAAAKGGGNRGGGAPPSRADARAERMRAAEAASGGEAASASPQEMPRLQKRYLEEVRAKLQEEFGYTNPMQVPKLEKIVINMGVGEATGDQKKLELGGRGAHGDCRAKAGEDLGKEGDRRIQDPQGPADRLQGHAAQGPHV